MQWNMFSRHGSGVGVALSLPRCRNGGLRDSVDGVPENLAHKGRLSKPTAVPGDGDAKYSEVLRPDFRRRVDAVAPQYAARRCHRLHSWGSARSIPGRGQGSTYQDHEHTDQPLPRDGFGGRWFLSLSVL